MQWFKKKRNTQRMKTFHKFEHGTELVAEIAIIGHTVVNLVRTRGCAEMLCDSGNKELFISVLKKRCVPSMCALVGSCA